MITRAAHYPPLIEMWDLIGAGDFSPLQDAELAAEVLLDQMRLHGETPTTVKQVASYMWLTVNYKYDGPRPHSETNLNGDYLTITLNSAALLIHAERQRAIARVLGGLIYDHLNGVETAEVVLDINIAWSHDERQQFSDDFACYLIRQLELGTADA